MNAIKDLLKDIRRATLLGSKDVLTIQECAMLTGMTVNTLYQKAYKRQIPHYKKGGIYFSKSEVETWLKSVRRPTNEEINNQAETYVTLKKTKTT